MYTVVKITISALVIGMITALAKHSPRYGGIIAALPLVSLLSLFWLYTQGERTDHLSQFLYGVLYGLPSTIVLIFVVAFSLKHSMPFFLSIVLGIGGWGLCLVLQKLLLSGALLNLR
ncbi:DUF3147 family protein [Fictibacillus sp. WQ 8-8]|uniref:DUF3147 family protein n=1 Tax=unclassified Fictibacillus TaxID=2644029 RepID=UPI0006A7D869|nr:MULTISPECIES: DUF3147 family protein [unclassified Fictibacillus]MCQ6264542.1 DUF3147 family protein [Fictibacillus sp. WQ 8-8]UZJ79528.1 DUF3147 family protein [Fictibacillus sp. KU28468]SFD39373.1 Protein of unknown function [Bacillus sp. OV194]